jgi:hypothetical protein
MENGEIDFSRKGFDQRVIGHEGYLTTSFLTMPFQSQEIKFMGEDSPTARQDNQNPFGLRPSDFIKDRNDIVVGF